MMMVGGLAVGGFRWEEIINYFAATKCASVGGTGYWIIVSLSHCARRILN